MDFNVLKVLIGDLSILSTETELGQLKTNLNKKLDCYSRSNKLRVGVWKQLTLCVGTMGYSS